MRPWLPMVWFVAGCVEAPTWFEDCDCADGEVCVEEPGAYRCAAVPSECRPMFADRGDDAADVELDCVVALCGEFDGSWSFEWDCHKNAGGVTRYADCTQISSGTLVE